MELLSDKTVVCLFAHHAEELVEALDVRTYIQRESVMLDFSIFILIIATKNLELQIS